MAKPQSSNATEMASRDKPSSTADLQNAAIKIKQEKIDQEIEKKIQLLAQQIKSEPSEKSDTDRVIEPNGHSKNKNSPEVSEENDDSNDSDSSSQDNDELENHQEEEEDEKKNIEPVKSSNEILTELFKVFNAAPPDELLDDKNLIEKAKKHKKEKKKKHKKQKEDDSDFDLGVIEVLGLEKSKHKKKKKHKHKQKDSSKESDKSKSKEKGKEREKSKDKEKSKSAKRSLGPDKIREKDHIKEGSKGKDRDKIKDDEKKLKETLDKYEKSKKLCTERKRHHDKDDIRAESLRKRHKTDERSSKSNNFYNGFKEREHVRDHNEKEKIKIKSEICDNRTRRYSEDSQSTDISLSDEESYLKEKEARSDYSKRKVHNSFYERDRDRGYSKDGGRDRNKDRDRDRGRDRDSSYRNRGFSRRYHSRYSRSRSRSRSHDLGIDKKRLLEIARKNAISMFKRGNLPGCDNMSQEIKDKVLIKMRYGGRTVEDLTEFCKKISNGENLSDLSSDEDSDVDKAGNSKAFHHPFQLKEREPIVMHIRNSKPILPVLAKTEEQTKAITMQFPVSSGQQHRMTEHWVPVEANDNLAPLPALPAASQATTIFKSNIPKNALGKPLPLTEEQEPAFKPVPEPNCETTLEAPPLCPPVVETAPKLPVENSAPAAAAGLQLSAPSNPATANTTNSISTPAPALTSTFVPDVPVPSINSYVFPQTKSLPLDVSSIISKRLNAMRRLQENPMDPEALKMMYNSQREMSSWASSKHLPGQFTGSTGANVLKPNELNTGPQVWARRDQLKTSKPVTGGMGMHLLQKMGWKPGEGLGREKNGSLQPLLLDVKLDKRGLVALEDCNRKGMPIKRRPGTQSIQLVKQTVEEKHPVCLLNELTSKRKWTPPMYTLVNENGPSHSKMFLFSVQVNGQTFTPDKACNTKKEAKLIAAKHCLHQIGILPSC